jgi:single-stranded DNA-binding protein
MEDQMSQVKASFTGSVVAEPEAKSTAGGAKFVEFPVYVNHQKKNKDSGSYEKTGDVTKIRVTLWGDLAENVTVGKGDLVDVSATIVEKEFPKKDGTTGRSLQTEWVESVVVKFKGGATAPAIPAEGGF